MQNADVIIIGAGVIGLSIAYNLANREKGMKIIVLEREKLPGMGSTAQCTGGIRHQFTSPVNVKLTKISLPFFQKFNAEMEIPIFYRQRGYLFCAVNEKNAAELSKMATTLAELNVPLSILKPEQVKEACPFLHTGDIIQATYCPRDAYADPGNVAQGYYKQARKRGVEVRLNEPVEEIILAGGRVCGVKTAREEYTARVVVNAAGPWFTKIAAMCGLQLPVAPYRRQVYVCSAMEEIAQGTPLVVDLATGFYLHVEKNGALLLGGADKDVTPGFDASVNWSRLDEFIEAAVHRVPCLDRAELVRAYAGLRAITPDYHGILGESSQLPGLFLAGGFGGQGFMHAPAIGLIAADLITTGATGLIDTAPLSPDRFITAAGNEEKVVF